MITIRRFFSLAIVLLTFAASCALASADHPSFKRAFNLPPSADLNYHIRARLSGVRLDGNALLAWHAADGKYRINVETRAMLAGRILTASSEGVIDEYGLAPLAFTEKRFRKSATTATFNRATKTIGFSASPASFALIGGEQDRTSIVWQLIANARGAPKRFTPGSDWRYFVAGQQDAEAWTFRVGKTEKINTPLGAMTALRISRVLTPEERAQQLDIWLAPSLEWYPVRIRFTEADGDFVEQTLDSVIRK